MPPPEPLKTPRPQKEPRTFSSDFRRFFGRGLAILLPSILTLWILWQAFTFVFNNVAVPINRGLRSAVVWVVPAVTSDKSQPAWFRVSDQEVAARIDPKAIAPLSPSGVERLRSQIRHQIRVEKLQEFWDAHWYLAGTGLVVAIILIYLAGVVLGGLIGRRAYARIEGLIGRIPGFKQVYPHVKQLVELVIGERPLAFKRVVLVEYPRKGLWTLGLVTSTAMKAVSEQTGRSSITIFIPSTPTPFTGFTISVPEDDVVDLPISIDEAIRFVLTGGVLIPERQAAFPPAAAVGDLVRQIAEAEARDSGPAGPVRGH